MSVKFSTDERLSGLSGVIRPVDAKSARSWDGASLSLHCVSTSLHMKWSHCIVAHGTLQRHLVESVSLYNWERHGWVCISMIWDGFVTSPIKHDQLNIFALNVCHRAPAWMGQTAKKLWSWCEKGIGEESYYFWVVMGKKLLSLRLSGVTFLFQPSFLAYQNKRSFKFSRQLLQINICSKLKYVTKQRLMT